MQLFHASQCARTNTEPYTMLQTIKEKSMLKLANTSDDFQKVAWDIEALTYLLDLSPNDIEWTMVNHFFDVWFPVGIYGMISREIVDECLRKFHHEHYSQLHTVIAERNVYLMETGKDLGYAKLYTLVKQNPTLAQKIWLPWSIVNEINCSDLSKLADSPNVLTIAQELLGAKNSPCDEFFQAMSPYLAQILLLPTEQWSDAPNDPCAIEGKWPFNRMLPQWRCAAVCDNGVGCTRAAQHNEVFCAFHATKPATMHFSRPSKRPFARDATSQEYQEGTSPYNYPLTKRPVSEMNFAREAYNYPPQQGFYLPIVRYQGVYYSAAASEKKSKYCGKFYFYEPNSHLYLYLGNMRLFATKVQAMIVLEKEMKKSKIKEFQIQTPVDVVNARQLPIMINNTKAKKLATTILLSPNLKKYDEVCATMHPNEFILSRYFSIFLNEADVREPGFVLPFLFPSDNPKNAHVEIGEFDFLDQIICQYAQALHIDTILFQHEIGAHDCVTEILDARTDTYNHLKYLQVNRTILTSRYPKIWFPRDVGVVVVTHEPGLLRTTIETQFKDAFGEIPPPFYATEIDCEASNRIYEERLETKKEEEKQKRKMRVLRDIVHAEPRPSDWPSDPETCLFVRSQDITVALGLPYVEGKVAFTHSPTNFIDPQLALNQIQDPSYEMLMVLKMAVEASQDFYDYDLLNYYSTCLRATVDSMRLPTSEMPKIDITNVKEIIHQVEWLDLIFEKKEIIVQREDKMPDDKSYEIGEIRRHVRTKITFRYPNPFANGSDTNSVLPSDIRIVACPGHWDVTSLVIIDFWNIVLEITV